MSSTWSSDNSNVILFINLIQIVLIELIVLLNISIYYKDLIAQLLI
jgi:hypothetical protein